MSDGLQGRRVTIIGAGIAGLAAARALALKGAEVTVHEQAPDIGEVGAGLQISPNGLTVIDALGLGEHLRALSVQADRVQLRDRRAGTPVLAIDLKPPRAAGDYLLVHRARLIEVLEAGARHAGVAIDLDSQLTPEDAEGDLIVGADGVRSAMRAKLNGPAAPFFTHQVAWRALLPEDEAAEPVVEVFLAPHRHLVSYPLAGGLRNIVAVEERRDWAEEGWRQSGNPDEMRAAFAGFAPRVQDWLAQVDQVHLWGLFRHPVARHWQDGTRVILGDAAHPTLPFLAQGANLALEDAWVLADRLSRMKQADALASYQAARQDRTTRVVDAASANARNYHLANPLVRVVAHTALRIGGAVAPDRALARFDWLYRYDATAV